MTRPAPRFEETYIGKVVLISAGLGVVAVVLRLISGETDRIDWIEAVGLWAITSAGMAAAVKEMGRWD